ncbi:MAG TPA: glutamate racemase [Termitinemataceae bacterium]|nr:glutamate racemase [Termitinemataceae bacterium]
MNQHKPVIFIDSGVGGLPYYESFKKNMPTYPAIYVADRANFPYGPKEKELLSSLLAKLVEQLVTRYDPALVVLACNTASVTSLGYLRSSFPGLTFVGTVPAVKPAVLATQKNRVLVLATERTVQDPYIYDLARQFNAQCAVIGQGAPELVQFVEREYVHASKTMREEMVRPYLAQSLEAGCDGLVLGCTHFLFLLEEFQLLAPPGLSIYHSLDGVAQRVVTLLKGMGLPEKRSVPGEDTEHSMVSEVLSAGEAQPHRSFPSSVSPDRLVITGSQDLDVGWSSLMRLYNFRREPWR